MTDINAEDFFVSSYVHRAVHRNIFL